MRRKHNAYRRQWHRQVEGHPGWPDRVGHISVPDDNAPRPALCWLLTPRRARQFCGLAVFPVPAEPSHGRGDAGGSLHLGHIRLSYGADQQAAVGSEIRPRIRQPRPSVCSTPRRRVAPRRGRHHHRRYEALALAHGRLGGLCSKIGFRIRAAQYCRSHQNVDRRCPAGER